MAAQYPLTVHVPIRGKLLIRLDGTEVLHEVGDFSQDIPLAFTPGPGEVSFQFEEKFWEGAVKNRKEGGRSSDPLVVRSTFEIILGVLEGSGVKAPAPLAEALLNTLNNEGRLRA